MNNWKSDLKDLYDGLGQKKIAEEQERKIQASEVEAFIMNEAKPALEEIKKEIEQYGRKVDISINQQAAGIFISYKGNRELDLELNFRGTYPVPIERFIDRKDGKQYRSEGSLRSGGQDYTIKDIKKDEILNFVIVRYRDKLR